MSMNSAGSVTVHHIDDVAVLTMTRPDAENRITRQMAESGSAALDSVRADPDTIGCILTGHGDIFCAGGDFRGTGPSTGDQLEFARAHNDLAAAMARLGKPLVAAVNGPALAGGLSLVTLCDLAVSCEGASFGLPEIERGLFPLLALTIMKDALPQKRFFELAYCGRVLTAQEAADLNLINEITTTDRLLPRAAELIGYTRDADPRIIGIGRDLYYTTRCLPPSEANEMARFALVAALKAMHETADNQ